VHHQQGGAARAPATAAAMERPLLVGDDKAAWAPPARQGAGPGLERWLVLLVFSWVEFNQALVWITVSASAPEARDLYGKEHLTPGAINLLLNWGPIMYLVFVPVVMVLLSSNFRGRGVYYTILIGAALCAAGSVVRLIPSWTHTVRKPLAVWLLHAGQILNGLAGPSMAGACTAFSCCWFAPEERTLATAIAYGICGERLFEY
jgi:FLVCR family MFS transporter